MVKVLVVEDELSILMGMKDNLQMEGYEVATATDGQKALELVERFKPDLIILDIMLPKVDGFEICRRVREQKSQAGIIIVSVKKSASDKVYGLELGADDYITKPFSLVEFLARVKAVLRRRGTATPIKMYNFGNISVDFENFEATKKGKKIEMSPREFKILRLFVENRGRVISRNEILNKVWGYEVFPTTRTVDNYIVKLRKAIEDDPADPQWIISVRSVGYKFTG
ncbi:MAG: response regulator transcription factor [Planctomycetota bacterium]|nr:response regulator transcription factor [Planctomycetota bacterium]